jgi:pimeloyl-ACP methyl ester carboxylesterase
MKSTNPRHLNWPKLGRKLLIWFVVLGLALVATVQIAAHYREARAARTHPPIGQMLDVNGTQVHAVVMGQGPDLVLIHGAGGNVRDFTFDFAERLTDRYRVILFDRPGLGWTGLPDDAANGAWASQGTPPQTQAALLQGAADQLGVRNPVVLGHSFGGSVALAWALARPDDTAAVVMVAGVAQPWPGDLGPFYTVLGAPWGGALVVPLITAFTPRPYVKDRIDSIFAPQTAPQGYADYIGAGLSMRRTTLRANVRQVNTLRPHMVAMKPQFPTLTMPMEIVHGDADDTVPLAVHSIPLSQQVPGAHLTVLPGVGHMPHHVDPQAVVDAIDRAAQRAGLR